jgi:hypothetical protein
MKLLCLSVCTLAISSEATVTNCLSSIFKMFTVFVYGWYVVKRYHSQLSHLITKFACAQCAGRSRALEVEQAKAILFGSNALNTHQAAKLVGGMWL